MKPQLETRNSKLETPLHIVLDARSCSDHFPGIGRYIMGLAEGLAALPDRQRLTLLYDKRATATRFDLPELAARTGAALYHVPASPFGLAQQRLVPAALRELRPELYHAAYYMRPYGPLPCPSITTIYDTIPRRYPAYFPPPRRLAIELATRLALLRSRHVLVISEATRDDLRRFYRHRPSRVSVTPLAADERFRPQPAEQVAALLRRRGLPERYLLYVGSNKPHKNLPLLVEAWGQALRRSSAALPPLVVAGHWEGRYPEARELAQRLGLDDAIRWAGPVSEEELPALYAGATIFAFPSLYEGFGLPPLEAMACGTPVLTSRGSAMEEVCGDGALLVEPTDAVAVADGLLLLLDDEPRRRELAQRGLRRAAEFSWQRTAALTRQAYQAALSGGG